uniref:DUF3226 domain-containing protein n=1 Tax=Candidatus Thiodubiliella endoseptemdiera TaxID=2738886 RepID=UPI0034DE2CB2
MYQCEAKSVLLLEGSDDCNIISKFCEDNAIRADFGFCNCGGDNQVLHKLNALLKKSDPPEVIGVILDADQNIDERYQEIKAKVADFYNLPKNMPKDGLVHLEKGLPKLGIWIMPNNQDNGALEEFYLELATDIDTAFINNTIQEAEKKELTSFKSQHRKKAIMHTYFAWQDTPGMPLHAAINKIVLDNNAEIAHVFKGWLISLFN